MKKKRINKREGGNCTEGSSSDEYRVGQVADSLFQNKAIPHKESPLASLFSAPASDIQPTFVPVSKVNPKKRRQNEDETGSESKVEKLSCSTQETVKKLKLCTKKPLSTAEKKVSDRESALQNADEEEIIKGTLIKQKKDSNPNAMRRTSKGENIVDLDEETRAEVFRKKKQNQAAERVKNKRTVFVGNLPISCTKQMLKSFFKEFGHIESLRFRSVARADPTLSRRQAAIQRKTHPKRNNINAYIVFKEEADAVKALQKNGTEITSGFHIRVDLASKFSAHDQKRSIFVGNLSYEMEEETLWSHFSDCGKVEAVRIVRDRNTGMGKGFGYVLFENTDAVHLAQKLDTSELMGRRIRVQRCVKKEKQRNPNSDRGSQGRPTNFKHKRPFTKKTKGKAPMSFVGETMKQAEKTKNREQKLSGPKSEHFKHKRQFTKKPKGKATASFTDEMAKQAEKNMKNKGQKSSGPKSEKFRKKIK